ncbi:DUF6789 family protein [Natronorarus salvus]|uniref:DUF6789 family protein n=1 Tax=Natronorarus salvus TaxID=3117733 RepID=UPI002F2647F8
MNRLARAVVAGTAATAVMMLVFLFLATQTRLTLDVPAIIARFVGLPGEDVVGMAIFTAAGILAWPVLFVAISPYLGRLLRTDDPTVQAVVFAFGLWIAFVLLGRPEELSAQFLFIYLFFTFLAHLAYGFTLGVVYERFGGKPPAVAATHSSGP